MDFPQTAPVKTLNQEHPDFTKHKASWSEIALLYEGGNAFKHAVISKGLFLTKAPKELPDVYTTRQKLVSYTNLLGNVIGWYISALFKLAPQFAKRIAGAEGEAALNIPQDVDDFCSQFEKDCNGAGQSFIDFIHDAVECALLYKTAYVALDLPMPDDDAPVETLQQQQSKGLLDPYLVLYTPSNVINWELDSYGNLEWIEVYIRVREQDFLEDPEVMDYWYYFDRKEVALYERPVKADGIDSTPQGGDESATLAEGYPRKHAMSDQNTVPIHRIVLPQGLWLSNRVLLPLINHLNQDNALDFGLWQSNLPQLWIEDGPGGEYMEPPTISPVGYHKIPHGGKMGFLEPDGKSYKAAQERIDNLEERIYKACYLMDQARTNRSTPTAQSGVSKQQDKTPSKDALSGIGAVLQQSAQNIYRDVLVVSGHKDIEPNVRGFDFSDKATVEDMNLLEQATIIPVNSPTFEREIGKKNVRFALPDMDPETLETIDDEINENPTPTEQEAQLAEKQRQTSLAQFTAAMKQTPPQMPGPMKPPQNPAMPEQKPGK